MADPLTTSIGGRTADKRLPRPTQVKNKTPANVQITAEQIVREAKEREEDAYQPPANRVRMDFFCQSSVCRFADLLHLHNVSDASAHRISL